MEVNVHEAKTHFPRLLERVALGEEVIIAKAGTPVAKLIPIESKKRKGFSSGLQRVTLSCPMVSINLIQDIEDLFNK